MSWVFITTVDASADTSLDFTDLSSTYIAYKFLFYAYKPSVDGGIRIRTDSNNGASFDAGASDYDTMYHQTEMESTSPLHQVFGDDTRDAILSGNSQEDIHTHDMELTLFNPSAVEFTKVFFRHNMRNSGTNAGKEVIGAVMRTSAAAVNAFQFLVSSGNIASGTVTVYGLLA